MFSCRSLPAVFLAALSLGSAHAKAEPGTPAFLRPSSRTVQSPSEPKFVTSVLAFLDNDPPEITPIPPQAIGEEQTLSLTVQATDPDNDPLTYSLGPNSPGTAFIDETTGQFSWTPTEEDGPGVYPVEVVVQDGVNGPARTTFQVTVQEINSAPYWDLWSSYPVNEGQLLSIDLTTFAFDDDLPANNLQYSLVSGPDGMQVNAAGQLTWTPTEMEDGTHAVIVRVSDNGSPSLSADGDIYVVVNEVNTPPTIDPMGPFEVNELEELTFTPMVTDPDFPGQNFTFSLGNHPPGVTLDTNTGTVHWTPTEAQGPGQYSIEVIVSDGIAQGQRAFVVDVLEVQNENRPPVLDNIAPISVREGELADVTFTASDPDSGQTLTFSLEGSVPPGAYVNPNDGIFTFRPQAIQCPGNYAFDVVVRDNGTPPMEARQTVTLDAVRESRTANVVYVWGSSAQGQLATTLSSSPSAWVVQSNDVLDGVSLVFTAGASGFARMPDLTWKAWGDNATGVVTGGTGASAAVTSPIGAPFLNSHLAVGGGSKLQGANVRSSQGLSIDGNGFVWSWGEPSQGQLGNGSSTSGAFNTSPSRNNALLVSSSAGDHSAYVRHTANAGYSLFTAGSNSVGQLGRFTSQIFDANFGYAFGLPVIQVATMPGRTYLLLADGRVFVSNGGNFVQQSGLGRTVLLRASVWGSVFAIDRDGSVRAWGRNWFGELGVGSTALSISAPMPVVGLAGVKDLFPGNQNNPRCVALRSDGTLMEFGGSGAPSLVPRMVNIDRIAGTADFGFFAYRYGPPNQRPVSNPGPWRTVTVPHDGNPATNTASVTLDGSLSTDPEGQPLIYDWWYWTGAAMADTTGITPTVNLSVGPHDCWLTVVDPQGKASRAVTRVNVLAEPNSVPKAVNDVATIFSRPTTLNPLANDSDADGDPLTLSIVHPGVFTCTVLPDMKLRVAPPAGYSGSSTVKYRIEDAYGASSTADFKIKVVNGAVSRTRP